MSGADVGGVRHQQRQGAGEGGAAVPGLRAVPRAEERVRRRGRAEPGGRDRAVQPGAARPGDGRGVRVPDVPAGLRPRAGGGAGVRPAVGGGRDTDEGDMTTVDTITSPYFWRTRN